MTGSPTQSHSNGYWLKRGILSPSATSKVYAAVFDSLMPVATTEAILRAFIIKVMLAMGQEEKNIA